MRKGHKEEQRFAMLKDVQAWVSVQDLCRKHGISMRRSISGGRNTQAWKSAM